MVKNLLATASLMLVFSLSNSAHAEKHKYPILKPAPPPCLFLVDEETGEPVGNAMNPPCELGSTIVNPGDPVDPVKRAQFGKTRPASTEDPKPKSR